MIRTIFSTALLLPIWISCTSTMLADDVQKISQYGITWTFDKPHEVGQFVTGDYWVVGPVTVVSVSPEAGATSEKTGVIKSIYGDVALQDDSRMRNGSMIVAKETPKQGYDSRLLNYDPTLSQKFPLVLKPDQSLVSTISNTKFPVTVMHEAIMWTKEKTNSPALKTAAILTCLDQAPPANAFRPAYAGSNKKIFTTKDIDWSRLPNLPPVANVPSWEQYERYFQRPWLDHTHSWVMLFSGPNENQVNYGREFSRLSSVASLMLMLDVPNKQKETLLYGFLQWGIDLDGLAKMGHKWNADGGHWNGRKWPLLFAGLMFEDTAMLKLVSTTEFSEDQQTYYGEGWFGQTALYQMVVHTHTYGTYEDRSPDTWDKGDQRQEGYRLTVSGGLPGTALAVQLMQGKAAWNHDAFFDYYDRWMASDDPYAKARGDFPRPAQEGHSNDQFVDNMWVAYRSTVPEQSSATSNRQWIWIDEKIGKYIDNQKPNHSSQK